MNVWQMVLLTGAGTDAGADVLPIPGAGTGAGEGAGAGAAAGGPSIFSNLASKMASKTSNLSIFLEKVSSRSSTVFTNWFKNVTVETLK